MGDVELRRAGEPAVLPVWGGTSSFLGLDSQNCRHLPWVLHGGGVRVGQGILLSYGWPGRKLACCNAQCWGTQSSPKAYDADSDGAGAVAGGSGNGAIVVTVVVAMAAVLMISTTGDVGSDSEDRNVMPTTTQTCSVLAVCFGTEAALVERSRTCVSMYVSVYRLSPFCIRLCKYAFVHVRLCTCMCICIYMCVCMHACMHACMDAWMDGWTYVCMNESSCLFLRFVCRHVYNKYTVCCRKNYMQCTGSTRGSRGIPRVAEPCQVRGQGFRASRAMSDLNQVPGASVQG